MVSMTYSQMSHRKVDWQVDMYVDGRQIDTRTHSHTDAG